MTDFDAYLVVDWSASSIPKPGEDSIWCCMAKRVGNRMVLERPENLKTREGAASRIRELLAENTAKETATLVGFDFPYGYPAGCAASLGLDLRKAAPWRAVWNIMLEKIKDDSKNHNNRFEVAADLNKLMSDGPYPFWGCPAKYLCSTLSPNKPSAPPHVVMPEYRLTEQRAQGAQPTWKLLGAGAVGSQALLGIPYVARLRDDPHLASVSRVWPFETGLGTLPPRAEREWGVLHVEIYPSIIKRKRHEDEIKDAAQVRDLAMHFARLDDQGCLSRLFERPSDLSFEEQRRVVAEEGWILGVE